MKCGIDELINGYLDEALSDEQQRELAEWIKSDPANASRFARDLMLHDRLRGELGPVADSLADERGKVIPFPVSGLAVRLIRIAAAIALMLTIVYWPAESEKVLVEREIAGEGERSPEGFAVIASVKEAEFGKDMSVSTGQRLGQAVLELNSGVIRLLFDSGVEVTLQGPARYELFTPDRTRLSSGLLTANVPPGAEGFRVDTPTAEITDLGTSFGVRLESDGSSHVSVFDGEVEVAEPDSGEKKLLKEGEEILVTAGRKLETVAINARPYEKMWPVSKGIAGSTGAFQLAPPWPRRLGALSSDDHIFIVPDGFRRRLRHPLKVNISRPGEVVVEGQLSPSRIPPGTPLRAFSLHYQPVESLPRPIVKRVRGSITFERPVLGLIVLSEELMLSAGRVSSRKAGEEHRWRQLDLTGIPAGDRISLSDDRRTVTLDLASPHRSSDLVRVIVDAGRPD